MRDGKVDSEINSKQNGDCSGCMFVAQHVQDTWSKITVFEHILILMKWQVVVHFHLLLAANSTSTDKIYTIYAKKDRTLY